MISVQPLALPARCATSIAGRYGAILADPPWPYYVFNGDKPGTAESHYKTMSFEDIYRLPVSDLAAPNCALFLWVVPPSLPQCIEAGIRWGFTYKTIAFSWIKRTRTGREWHSGMGHWTLSNVELCLLFTRGRPARKSRSVKQVIASVGQLELFPPLVAPITEHSAKPHEQYGRIEALLDGPYLELFARNAAPGWDTWGNEAPNCIDWRPILQRAA